MADTNIRIMIVDDSVTFRHFLSQKLSECEGFEVVGTAVDGLTAKHKLRVLHPDVVVLDMELPVLRGADFLREVLPAYPELRVVVISYISNNVFEALHAGAVDFVSKPDTRPGYNRHDFLRELVGKIKVAAASKPRPLYTAAAAVPERPAPPAPEPPALSPRLSTDSRQVIAIGASTGGTEALAYILERLPATTPGILVVQHMPPVFTKMFADRLDVGCKMHAREAKNGDRVRQGEILIAPGDYHMRLFSDRAGYYVRCAHGDKVSGHCPSVDVLFESVAAAAGYHGVGILLTGMGSDGAKQLLAMKEAGAYTIGQDQASCVVYGMPMVAQRLGALTVQLPLTDIPAALLRYFSSHS